MTEPRRIAVLHGGPGPEREVSLRSGEAVAAALARTLPAELIRLDAAALPEGLDDGGTVVFPALHGTFGEDGALQALLEEAGVAYAGSGAAASRLCMAKEAAKAVAAENGVAVPEGRGFGADGVPSAAELVGELGGALVLKPADAGSSVRLSVTEDEAALAAALAGVDGGRWLVERRIRGRELTVGVLGGRALGVVEVVSVGGVYDYAAKYTPGATEYRYPADVTDSVRSDLERSAETVFRACGCRDFARVDFMLEGAVPYFLEINTLPGLTETSLLPKSAACAGYDFEALALALVAPAVGRWRAAAKRGTVG